MTSSGEERARTMLAKCCPGMGWSEGEKQTIATAMLTYAAEREAAAYARAAEVARGWKSSLRPGSAVRLAGHTEAARDIASAIEALGEAKG